LKKGEIWWANLPDPAGRRPVVILSRDIACKVRNSITVAEITRTIRNIPVEIRLTVKDGMPSECVINVDNIFTISKGIFVNHICTLSKRKILLMEEAIKFAFDIN